ncbi:leucyl/phenylalanyl-tRNA--protein transferase [Acetobacteroides hydrogenigenes]|uniref:Leucyl/phenylalanyl-tRNA--protein transferase n=1 Tax=Acetobacteroides hydrogenigenes TaxID=979970 RepID=A0A4R2EV21_9BACT|nr:leucyl/phenylalanyl-tRNA--protein transferase [Acetobacteroides hydrogenigenes]TCN73169.1 leucyl/phenylalanyl-tRNA--protein transferase [Acetobacteroides hydrogenigenes]
MPVYILNAEYLNFPPVEDAEEDGMIAVGGDISPERMLVAYSEGIFPWYDPTDIPVWYCPNPRFVLYPHKLKVSKSMRQLLRAKKYSVTFDTCFDDVVKSCGSIAREGQEDPYNTWISDEMMATCHTLHQIGFMHSVEVWNNEGNLVGGLYGGVLGRCFFGESMFAKASNASKFGFIMLVKNLEEQGFKLVDCQIYSDHLLSLGAEEIPRPAFIEQLKANISDLKKEGWTDKFRTDFEF